MLRLTEWMADYYLCPLGQVLEAVLPAGVRSSAGTKRITLLSLAPGVKDKLDGTEIREKAVGHREVYGRQCRSRLSRANWPAPPNARWRRSRRCGAREFCRRRRKRISAESQREAAAPRQPNFKLNADQQKALEAILDPLRAQRHETILIHGVTGSGKTEVYMQAIQEVISYGRQAIMLVPEISLTPQTRERFRARFDSVAVLHSHLRDAERHWHWERIARGEVQVVVGARSAVFAPTPHLGLIVLDEEHETTFKQDTVPRYHAREVALWRAREEKVPHGAGLRHAVAGKLVSGDARRVSIGRHAAASVRSSDAGGGHDRFAHRIRQPQIARSGFAADAPGD